MEKETRQAESSIIKIVLFGPESTGKTTMCKALALHYNTVWVEEYSRIFAIEKWENQKSKITKNDIIDISNGQLNLENHLTKEGNEIIFCDTNILETKIYAELYYNHVPEVLEKQILHSKYDYYFLTDIDVKWEKDEVRDMPLKRKKTFNRFEQELIDSQLPYTILTGNHDTRLLTARKIIDQKFFSTK